MTGGVCSGLRGGMSRGAAEGWDVTRVCRGVCVQDVADLVNNVAKKPKTSTDCDRHYNEVYLNSRTSPLPDTSFLLMSQDGGPLRDVDLNVVVGGDKGFQGGGGGSSKNGASVDADDHATATTTTPTTKKGGVGEADEEDEGKWGE